MHLAARDPAGEADQPDYSHARVRAILLALGRERGTCEAQACAELFAFVERAAAIRRQLVGRLAERGLTEAKFCTLTLLAGAVQEIWTPTELAHHSGVTRATMTEVLDQMVAAGWVTRARSENDRRTWVVRLTKKGREIADDAIDALMMAAKEMAAGEGKK